MKRLQKKLRSQAGESITESLVAVLIAALALVMLAVAVVTAAHVVTVSRDKLDRYYTANEQADGVVKMTGGTEAPAGITLTDTTGAIAPKAYSVTYFVNDTFDRSPVVAYAAGE